MGYFRHPKNHGVRKSDQAIVHEDVATEVKPKGRVRSGKAGRNLASERDDKTPAAIKDRGRGKSSHSSARKAKAKSRDK